MIRSIGIDENGLGSRLGPLLVTAAAADLTPRGEALLREPLPPAIARDLDDSKALVSHRKHALAEAWARALYPAAQSPLELLTQLSLWSLQELQAPCAAAPHAQCWGTIPRDFQAATQEVERVRQHLETLASLGLTLHGVRSAIHCTWRLNESLKRGEHRFLVDLHSMEALFLSLGAGAPGEVRAECGLVGGIRRYGGFFGPLREAPREVLCETRERAEYHFPDHGTLAFSRDADAHHPLVMLASLVGKYLRELLMGAIVAHYGEGATCSGYHDRVTAAFVERTALLREARAIPLTCFERQAAAAKP